jgi:putative FmdB family regulatory protein
MPIYEYECTQCGAVEEAIQNFVTDYAGKNHNAASAPKKSEDNSAPPSAETPAASSKTSDSSDS